MTVPQKQRRKIVLKGLKSIIEWQCAHDAVRHAKPGERVIREYDTPEGPITLGIQPVGQEKLVISRAKVPGRKQ